MDISSDDYETDMDSDDESNNNNNQLQIYTTNKTIRPICSFRFIRRLNGKFSLEKMKTDDNYRLYFLYKCLQNNLELPDESKVMIDDFDTDNDDDDDIIVENQTPVINSSNNQEHNLDDIREKALEHDRQQIKGIQLANAGQNNLKIVNNYSVTSNTCTLL